MFWSPILVISRGDALGCYFEYHVVVFTSWIREFKIFVWIWYVYFKPQFIFFALLVCNNILNNIVLNSFLDCLYLENHTQCLTCYNAKMLKNYWLLNIKGVDIKKQTQRHLDHNLDWACKSPRVVYTLPSFSTIATTLFSLFPIC